MRRKIQGSFLFGASTTTRRCLKYLLGTLFVAIGLFYAGVFLIPVVPGQANIADISAYKVKINPQSSLTSIAEQLGQQGLTMTAPVFNLAARSLFIGSKLKPGTYLLPNSGSLGKILLQIARGDRVKESITIIPGTTIWQLRKLIDSHPALVHQTKEMSTKELLQTLNLNFPSDEGIFLPDTYIFDPDDLDISIYRRAAQGMKKQVTQIWDQRAEGLPLKTPYELLILASIIEKETGRLGDRDMVSAVFINRLDRGMPLQTDPTVIYGIGPKFDGNLRKIDLRRDSAYNTYTRRGLPPTPIAMPSKESLYAAVHPAKSNALYFVAKGDGSSHFSQTLKEHETAVDKYQRKISSSKSTH